MVDYDVDLLENAVENASPAEMTLMLYDGAIRFANEAMEKLYDEEFDEAGICIAKIGNIIQELQVSLNREYAISEPMHDLYKYMFKRLCRATADETESKAIVAEVRGLMRDFRDTWRKAMELSAA